MLMQRLRCTERSKGNLNVPSEMSSPVLYLTMSKSIKIRFDERRFVLIDPVPSTLVPEAIDQGKTGTQKIHMSMECCIWR